MKTNPPESWYVVTIAIALTLGGLTSMRVLADEAADPPHLDVVRQLGDSSYPIRVRAEQRLMQIGMAAKPALLRGLRDEDLEVRLSAHRILIRVLQIDFDTCVTVFIQGSDDVSPDRFPGWQRFRERVSHDTLARRLFVDMIRAESSLLTAFERHDPNLFKQYTARLRGLTNSPGQLGASRVAVSGPSLAAWLFVGAELWEQTTGPEQRTELSTLTRWLLSDEAEYAQMVVESSKPAVLRQLLALWTQSITQSDHWQEHANALQLVLKFELSEPGIKLARHVLETTGDAGPAQQPAVALPFAAIVLARFGTVDDARYLVPHLADTRVFNTWTNPQLQPDPILNQVRDVMLALLLRWRGQSPEKCGFELLEPFPETLYRVWTFGFLTDHDREVTFTKWRQVAAGK